MINCNILKTFLIQVTKGKLPKLPVFFFPFLPLVFKAQWQKEENWQSDFVRFQPDARFRYSPLVKSAGHSEHGKKSRHGKSSSAWTSIPLLYEETMIGIFTGHLMVFFLFFQVNDFSCSSSYLWNRPDKRWQWRSGVRVKLPNVFTAVLAQERIGYRLV